MRSHLAHRTADERGSALIDVLMSAFVLLLIVGATFTALDRASARSGQQRGQASATNFAMAQMDKLRSQKFETLRAYNNTVIGTDAVAGTTMTAKASSQWSGAPAASASSCADAARSPEMLRVTVTVTWTGMGNRAPVKVSTLVAAPVATPSQVGAIVVQVTDRQGYGVKDLLISLNDPAASKATTDANGCVKFSDLTAGTYGISFNSPPRQTIPGGITNVVNDPVTVTEAQTTSKAYQYDEPQATTVSFQYPLTTSAGGAMAQASVSAVSFQKMVGTTQSGTAKVQNLTPAATSMAVPTTSWLPGGAGTYQVYTGACKENNPAGVTQQVTVPGSTPLTVTMPAVRIRVNLNNNPLPGVKVYFKLKGTCTLGTGGTAPVRSPAYLTDSNGYTSIIPLPYGTYTVCGEAPPQFGAYRKSVDIAVTDTTRLTQPATITEAGAVAGTCPS